MELLIVVNNINDTFTTDDIIDFALSHFTLFFNIFFGDAETSTHISH